MPIFYEGVDVGTRRVDFLVEEKVMRDKGSNTTGKCTSCTSANYLEAYKL